MLYKIGFLTYNYINHLIRILYIN